MAHDINQKSLPPGVGFKCLVKVPLSNTDKNVAQKKNKDEEE